MTLALEVDVAIEEVAWEAAGLEALAERAIAAALGHLGVTGTWEVSLLGCDDARIAALNAGFRGRPKPTNVLSWPSGERGAEIEGERPSPPDPTEESLGDIAISYDTCVREAEAAGITLDDHATHLVVHATLHLLGYDHDREGDGDLMEKLETEILAVMGLPDPYSR